MYAEVTAFCTFAWTLLQGLFWRVGVLRECVADHPAGGPTLRPAYTPNTGWTPTYTWTRCERSDEHPVFGVSGVGSPNIPIAQHTVPGTGPHAGQNSPRGPPPRDQGSLKAESRKCGQNLILAGIHAPTPTRPCGARQPDFEVPTRSETRYSGC